MTIRKRIALLEAGIPSEHVGGIFFRVKGEMTDAYRLTIGTREDIIERRPEECQSDFETRASARMNAYSCRKGAPVPMLMPISDSTHGAIISAVTGQEMKVTNGASREAQ